MSTLAKSYLFAIKDGKVQKGEKLFMPCDRYHPDTPRFVVLSESACKENNFKSLAVLARYMGGEYYGVVTGDILPIIKDNTVWTESSIAEAPFRVVSVNNHQFYGNASFEDLVSAMSFVNNLNMGTFGCPGYTVANQYGIPVDTNGHLYF